MRDFFGSGLLVPQPQFLGTCRGMPCKSDFAGIGNAEGIWISGESGDIFKRAFRSESNELRVETIFHESEESAVFGPPKVKYRPVHASAREVLSGFVAMPGEDEIVWRGTVF